MEGRNFFINEDEYIDFLECRCRSLARATKCVKGMLEDRNKQIAMLSKDLTKEHDKRIKAQMHIARLKKEKKKDKMIAIHTFGDKPVTFEFETDGEKIRELFNV